MGEFVHTGLAADVQGEEDYEYIDKVIEGKPKKELRTLSRVVKLPIAEIERALTPGAYKTEPGDPQHIRERMEDRRDCPIAGCHYQHWNLEVLRSHIVRHEEIRAFKSDIRRAGETYDLLQARSDKLRTQLSVIRQEYMQVEERINRFDLAEHRSRQKQASRMLALLGA